MKQATLLRRITWTVASAIAMTLPCGPAGAEPGSKAPAAEALSREVDQYLEPYVLSRNFSGAVLLARGDEVLVRREYGMASYEHSVPVTSRTRFQIGSISKTFTAAAVLLLQERGLLRVEDPVSRFIPDFPNAQKMTIHHLLVHTSGLPRFVYPPERRQEMIGRAHTAQDLVDAARTQPPAFAPGEGSRYSNANFALLAYIIEQASGQSYGDFLKNEIFAPLALDAGHRGDAREIVADLASGYSPVEHADLERSAYYDYSVSTGSGSVYATAEDLLRWYRALRGGRLLRPKSLELMFTPQEGVRGYGWILGEELGRDAVQMSGWDGVGFGARFLHFVDEELTVVVLVNLNVSSLTAEVADSLAAMVLGEGYEKLNLAESVESALAREIAGRYRFGADFYVPGATMEVIDANGRLLVSWDRPGARGALLALSEDELIHRQHWLRVVLVRDDDGRVTGLKYGRFEARKESEG